jgi:serine/threonine protein kinase
MITLQKGRYAPLELIGSGTTSRVEKARDNVIGRTVALKTFLTSFGENLEEQFLREAQIVGQLSHPAVIQLYDVGINEEGTPFLVMEYVAGKTLEDHLASGTLTIQQACAWGADLAGALAAAHRPGIIHGDIKPGNILVTQENKVKLGDFGIARFAAHASGSDRVMGTPAYMAPEQIRGEAQDERSDQFSFGIVLYQMLTGVQPFAGRSVGAVCSRILNTEPVPPSQINPAVPQALDRAIARCLAKNPKERFASCKDLAKALYPFARSRPQPAAPAVTSKRSWWLEPASQREMWMVASALVLLAISIQTTLFFRANYIVPSTAPQIHFIPGVPYEAYNYTRQTIEAQWSEFSADVFSPRPVEKKPSSPRLIAVKKVAPNPQTSSGHTLALIGTASLTK